jgi:two-component system phosphate regulon sensor histidine kinase PhoR
MPRWFTPGLALLAGGVAALATGAGAPSIVAFAGVLIAVLLAGSVARRWFDEDAPEPVARAAAPEPAGDMLPPGFGRVLLETLPPLLIISRSGRVTYANRAAHSALPRIQTGAHYAHTIRAPAFVEAVAATLVDGAERIVPFTAYEGSERSLEARIALLSQATGPGAEPQVVVLIEDRTRVHRAEMLRSDFIANASHELRTPLASIIGYIETLQHHARDDSEARERFLAIMAREAGRMQRLVDDLMSLSRIELSEHVRPVEEWSLNSIAVESASAALPVAAAQGVDLRIEVEPGGAMVVGDRDQLAQVFGNLIDNAMKYGGPGSTVRVRAAPPNASQPNRCGVAVEDTGPGIAREHLHRLTERFYRVNVSSSRNKGGTGLGLAIVKHILNRHRGRLEIASTPGEGSRFTVWLPCAAEAEEAAAAESRQESVGSRIRSAG